MKLEAIAVVIIENLTVALLVAGLVMVAEGTVKLARRGLRGKLTKGEVREDITRTGLAAGFMGAGILLTLFYCR